jgi:hypothetical protein
MTAIGYARVSTTDQDLSIQEAALGAAGCQVIRAEKRSGTTTEGREALLPYAANAGRRHRQPPLLQVRFCSSGGEDQIGAVVEAADGIADDAPA